VGKVESMPRLDGRNMVMVLAPDKRAQAAAKATAPPAEDAPGGPAPLPPRRPPATRSTSSAHQVAAASPNGDAPALDA
jgi:hypothetical protein